LTQEAVTLYKVDKINQSFDD